MTENELMELIHKNVHESLLDNEELIGKNMCRMIGNHYPSTMEGIGRLCSAVSDYTVNIAKITCVSILKVLEQAGVLEIKTAEKEG